MQAAGSSIRIGKCSIWTVMLALMTVAMILPGCQAGQQDTDQATAELVLQFGDQESSLKLDRVVQITGQSDGTIICDGNQIGLTGIAGAVSLRHGASPDLIAVLDLAATTGCHELEQILAAVREGGVTNLAFTRDLGTDRTAVPFMLPPVDLKLPTLPEEQKLTVEIGSEGDLSVEGQVLPRDELVRHVAGQLQSVKGLVVYVEPEAGARYAEFFNLMIALREAGATRISLWGALRAG